MEVKLREGSAHIASIRPIHPFPARMAPDLALDFLSTLRRGSIVLDPMAGSGTVLRHALSLGHRAIGFDMDPLSVLISSVWTRPIRRLDVMRELDSLLTDCELVDLRKDKLPWVRDTGTWEFVKYWFDVCQRRQLHRVAYCLFVRSQMRLGPRRRAAVDVLRVALSRIIITKEQKASLARDTSHSRPHRVLTKSVYDVIDGFTKSTYQLADLLDGYREGAAADVRLGDARSLQLPDRTIDAVVTSPPYLNAIDYIRGHRLSLVWLGYSIRDLRKIRGTSIGAERGVDQLTPDIRKISKAIYSGRKLPGHINAMIYRYGGDLLAMAKEISRVLKKRGSATFVVGNSCLRGCFIKNSEGVLMASRMAGLSLIGLEERELPMSSRYLPFTAAGSLSKRMRTETILTFRK